MFVGQNRKINDYILKKNIISEDICEHIIKNISESNYWQMHEWYNPIDKYHTQSHNKELKVLENDETQELIKPYIHDILKFYHKHVNAYDSLCHQFSSIRFNKYEPGTLMKKHFDHIYSLFDGGNQGVPVLSIVGTLNQSYSGGKFIFFDDYEIKMKTGDILVFPSNFMYPHKVTEINSGERYSFVSWAW